MSSPFQTEGFERLPESEKARVRAAMDKAWTSPELREAKDRYMKANEEFRAAMRKALEQVDPGVVAILEKIKPQEGAFDSRNWSRLPPPEDAGFVNAAIHRLEMEVVTFARPENRDRLRAIHGRVMEMPPVIEALKKLTDAPPGERMELLRQLRDAYRIAIVKELPPRGGSDPEAKPAVPNKPGSVKE
jgi:hypothetical protein